MLANKDTHQFRDGEPTNYFATPLPNQNLCYFVSDFDHFINRNPCYYKIIHEAFHTYYENYLYRLIISDDQCTIDLINYFINDCEKIELCIHFAITIKNEIIRGNYENEFYRLSDQEKINRYYYHISRFEALIQGLRQLDNDDQYPDFGGIYDVIKLYAYSLIPVARLKYLVGLKENISRTRVGVKQLIQDISTMIDDTIEKIEIDKLSMKSKGEEAIVENEQVNNNHSTQNQLEIIDNVDYEEIRVFDFGHFSNEGVFIWKDDLVQLAKVLCELSDKLQLDTITGYSISNFVRDSGRVDISPKKWSSLQKYIEKIFKCELEPSSRNYKIAPSKVILFALPSH